MIEREKREREAGSSNRSSLDVKQAVENICTLRLPKSMHQPLLELLFPIRKKVEDSFVDSYNKGHPGYHVRSSYIRQYMNTIARHHYDESFDVLYYNPRFNSAPRRKLLTYEVWPQAVVTRNDKNDLQPERLFTLKELMYITLLEDGSSVEVSHLNGAPDTINFTGGPLQMKSFVALLAGYYRLSYRWSFDLCRQMPSPWIERLRKVSAHGPVDKPFTKAKLAKFADDAGRHVPFIFRLSRDDFTLFRISFQDRSYSVKVDLRRAVPEFVLLGDPGVGSQGGSNGPTGRSFATHQALFEYIRSSVVGGGSGGSFGPNFGSGSFSNSFSSSASSLLSPSITSNHGNHHPHQKVAVALIPSENDLPLNLLLCRDVRKIAEEEEAARKFTGGTFGKGGGTFQQQALKVIPAKDVKRSRLTITTNGLFCIRYGDIKGEEKVTVKEFLSELSVGHYLAEVSRWIHLSDSSIVNCRGLIISPFAVLFEFCGTSLADLYQSSSAQKRSLPVGLLVQAAYYLAKALDYLFSQEFVHGAIRFEHLYVSHFTERTLHIKLGDPIGLRQLMGVNDINRERPWLPPEFFNLQNPSSSFLFHKPTSYGDVWAFGTTLWQIFNGGERPLDDPRLSLALSSGSPSHSSSGHTSGENQIPEDMGQLMRQCWLDDYSARIQPCSIFGRMSRLLNALYSRNEYSKINNNVAVLPHADSVPSGLDSRVNGANGSNAVTVTSGNDYYNSFKRQFSGAKKKAAVSRKSSSSSSTLIRALAGSRQSLSNLSLTSGQTDTTSVNLNEDSISIYDVHLSTELYELALINDDELKLLKTIGKVFC